MKNKEKYFDEICEALANCHRCRFVQTVVGRDCEEASACNTCEEETSKWMEQSYHEPLKPCPFCGSEAELTKPGFALLCTMHQPGMYYRTCNNYHKEQRKNY